MNYWINWGGGECPLPAGTTEVELRYRDDDADGICEERMTGDHARELSWSRTGGLGDIMGDILGNAGQSGSTRSTRSGRGGDLLEEHFGLRVRDVLVVAHGSMTANDSGERRLGPTPACGSKTAAGSSVRSTG